MRAGRIRAAVLLAGAGLGLAGAGLGLAAPAALAAPDPNITSFGFDISPKSVKPGGSVTLHVTECDRGATASSGVFDTVRLRPSDGGEHSGTARVDEDARPGAVYDVTFTCGKEAGTTSLKILDRHGSGTGPTSPDRPGKGTRGGLGGSVTEANPAQIAGGATLLALAVSGVVISLRRRRAHDG
ncbi:hypothetical protein ACH429_12675 [Streptomyces pathocidini]|uniref:Lipoprotein n=1 Tax=Streptomyces pathocidini TaxID=1650571 RepID=A0ABW7UW67_9ACTN|nr:hypothetical protein [Streptomyces pathocidini]